MRDLKNKLTSGKGSSNIQSRRGKNFGYHTLGFGSGPLSDGPVNVNYMVVAGGAGGGD